MADSPAGGAKVEMGEELEPETNMVTEATTIKVEAFKDVTQWEDAEVKEEQCSFDWEEMKNEDQVKIFLLEPKMEMTEVTSDVMDPISLTGRKNRENDGKVGWAGGRGKGYCVSGGLKVEGPPATKARRTSGLHQSPGAGTQGCQRSR